MISFGRSKRRRAISDYTVHLHRIRFQSNFNKSPVALCFDRVAKRRIMVDLDFEWFLVDQYQAAAPCRKGTKLDTCVSRSTISLTHCSRILELTNTRMGQKQPRPSVCLHLKQKDRLRMEKRRMLRVTNACRGIAPAPRRPAISERIRGDRWEDARILGLSDFPRMHGVWL